jgi:hypothetical protein
MNPQTRSHTSPTSTQLTPGVCRDLLDWTRPAILVRAADGGLLTPALLLIVGTVPAVAVFESSRSGRAVDCRFVVWTRSGGGTINLVVPFR